MINETSNFKQSEYIAYKDGYKYQTDEDTYYKLSFKSVSEKVSTRFITLYPDGWLHIKAGYCWDGASGPTVDSKNSQRAGLIHDAFYQLMRYELDQRMWRDEMDEEFEDILKKDGMGWFRRNLWEKSVAWFAGFASNPRNRKKVIFAP